MTISGPFVTYVAPTIGSVLGVIMLLSPIKAVWNIRKTQKLGDINPLPYPMTAINCCSWVIYGAVISDPFIAPANILGMIAGVFFTMTSLPCCSRKMADVITALFLTTAGLFGLLSMVHTFALDASGQKRMWGAVAVVILMLYYVIPLSTMVQIVKQRDASSIYLPLACAAVLNGGMWTIYGLAIGDINIWGPNCWGVLIGCLQVALRLFYRSKGGIESGKGGILDGSGTSGSGEAGNNTAATSWAKPPGADRMDSDHRALLSASDVSLERDGSLLLHREGMGSGVSLLSQHGTSMSMSMTPLEQGRGGGNNHVGEG